MLKSILKSLLIIFISFSIFYLLKIFNYTVVVSIRDINDYFPIIIYIFTISLISNYFYNSESSYLLSKKSNFSINLFKFISEFIHISSVLICVNSILSVNFMGFDFHDSLMFMYLGISISAISIGLFVSSKISLGKNYSPCYDQRKPKRIVMTGTYRFIRHPIYSSNILLITSVVIISGSYLILFNLLLLVLFYTISAFKEEKYLISKFPEYQSYSNKTGMFIPKYRK